MARILDLTGRFGNNEPIFDVEMAVGPDAPNRRDDVFLVQYLLHKTIGEGQMLYRPPIKVIGVPPGDLAVDGRFGPQTAAWIRGFQRAIAEREGGCGPHRDGRVDPARGRLTSAITRTIYTIDWLNEYYDQMMDILGEDRNLTLKPDCPPELSQAVIRAVDREVRAIKAKAS